MPFSRTQATKVLGDCLRSSQGGVWNQYLSLDARLRQLVDDLTSEVNCSHARTLIGIDQPAQTEDPATILIAFYALGFPTEPVRVKFEGRQVEFPYEACLTWEVSIIEGIRRKRGL